MKPFSKFQPLKIIFALTFYLLVLLLFSSYRQVFATSVPDSAVTFYSNPNTASIITADSVITTSGHHSSPPPTLRLKALNPGYLIDNQANIGEFIELVNLSAHSSISLAGFSLRYTNSSGKSSNIFMFPDGSQLVGETLLLKYASSPDAGAANLTYTKTLAQEAGPLELVYLDTVVDSVCWRGKTCLPSFSRRHPTSLVRSLPSLEFNHQTDYHPVYHPGAYLSPPPSPDTEEAPLPVCQGLIFNELFSYYESNQSEQFVELHNISDENLKLQGCSIRYRKQVLPLFGEVAAGDFFLVSLQKFPITKNPSSTGRLELFDANSDLLDTLIYPHGQKKSAAYARFGHHPSGQSKWLITFQPTPGAQNIFQEFRSCPAGKIINPETGNCIKSATLSQLSSDCPPSFYRNPATGRCKKLVATTDSSCPPGYERHPETKRCRKIKQNTGAPYPVSLELSETRDSFLAFGAVVLILLGGVFYTVFQFRHELQKFFRKIIQYIKKSTPSDSS
ncbi:MAG: hypothetical protein Q4A30_00050 [Candidatus Saccharibacteria bacterium]|nr:hypothetical protein [Candidatus Saccharibacteria bacterium]